MALDGPKIRSEEHARPKNFAHAALTEVIIVVNTQASVHFALLSWCLFWGTSLAQEGPLCWSFSSQLVLSRQCMETHDVRVHCAIHFPCGAGAFHTGEWHQCARGMDVEHFHHVLRNFVNETKFEIRLGEVTDDKETTLAVASLTPENLLKFRFRAAMLGLLVAAENINVDEVTLVHERKRKPRRLMVMHREMKESSGPINIIAVQAVYEADGALEKVQAGLHRNTSVARGGKGANWSKNGSHIGGKGPEIGGNGATQSLLEFCADGAHCTERARWL